MRDLSHLVINQQYIAVFGSGNSVDQITAEEFDAIKSCCFVITMNYAPVRLQGHLNIWSDQRVSEFLEAFYKERPKETLLVAQKNRVSQKFAPIIDYWFSQQEEKLKGNYTIVWVLQLLKKYFPNKTLLLFGIDMYQDDTALGKWYDRYTDFDRKKRGINFNTQSKLDQCAIQIKTYCSRDGVFNCNLKSRLDYFEKRDWRSLLKINVLHLCSTPLAGAPAHLSRILNKYSYCCSISLLRADFNSPGTKNLRWDYDYKTPSQRTLQELIEWADIIHHHRKIYPVDTRGKKSLIQYHSPPNGYKAGITDSLFNGKKLVIAQYHPRYYSDAYIVPNLIDIWDKMYLPGIKSTDKVKIFYSWATEVKGGWSDKGSTATRQILERIKTNFGNKTEICILNNRPYEECMAEKSTAHICIDECVTGSYHLQSLEGCSVGALTFNNIDEKTLGYLSEVSGQDSHPFEKSSLEELYSRLCFYINQPELLSEKGRQARAWMEQYWNPAHLAQRYLKAYHDILQHNHILPEKQTPPSSSFAVRQQPTPQASTAPRSGHPNQAKTAGRFTPTQKTVLPALPGRPISELFRQYAGRDIYIFGTGPSLLKVDPEDYRDELCFGINFAFEVMPHIDYHFVHVIEVYEAIRQVVDNERLVLPETLVPQWYRQPELRKYKGRIVPDNPVAYVYPVQDPNEKILSRKTLSLEREARIFTWSTTTHSAIHLAAYMGARNIYLIGMDYQLYPGGRVHFDSKTYPAYGSQDWNANRKHQQGDEWLARQLLIEGIELRNLSLEIQRKTDSYGNKRHHPAILQR